IFGIAGPNGAGKSTLINMMLGFLRPSAGTVTINGHKPRVYIETSGASYLSELIAIPPTWNLERALALSAVLADLPAAERRARVNAVIELLGLDEHRRKRVKQ